MSTRRITRHWIPHTTSSGVKIAGDLEQPDPERGTHGQKVALILHGTMGHKDYLFQKRLAASLPCDSFRFDFRGNHETGGEWKMSAFEEDVEDIAAVAEYLTRELGYTIDLVIGHSKGSVAGMRWLITTDEGKRVRGYVNIAGRYRMDKIKDYQSKSLATINRDLKERGYYEWKVVVARKEVVGVITPEDQEKFSKWDTSPIWSQVPDHVHFLTIQGMKDETVPPYDAIIYARALGSRFPGTHNLHFVEEAGHNFVGFYDEVVQVTKEWFNDLETGVLRTGIRKTGVKL